MTNILPDEKTLSEAFSIIAATSNTEVVIDKLRDLLKVDHVVYYMPKPSGAAFVRLTYPASWIKRYLQMNYANVDPISREAASFLADALSHGIGPHGFSIPLSENGHWALFSISFSGSEQEWRDFLVTTQSTQKGVLKPRHFLGVRLAVMMMSWISSSDTLSMSI